MAHRPDRIAEVVNLGEQGVSAAEISRRSGIARETVRDWLAGRTPRSSRPRAGSCERCGGPAHRFADLPAAYPYLLGLYLGDGSLSRHPRGVFRLRVTLDLTYPEIIAECRAATLALLPAGRRVSIVPRKGCCDVSSYSKAWPCLLPQHGPGKKHRRPIVLTPWQVSIVDRDPKALLRGLIHSDGCRFINTGTNWRNPRYSFSNRSPDIRRIFCDACDRLGLRYTTCPHTVYVSRKQDVAALDQFIGPKT
jgi:hypothetical protein